MDKDDGGKQHCSLALSEKSFPSRWSNLLGSLLGEAEKKKKI